MKDTFWKVIVTVVLIAFLTFGAGLFIVQDVNHPLDYDLVYYTDFCHLEEA